MAEESYEARIAAATEQLDAVEEQMSQHYPGTPEWERLNGKAREWEALLIDLRRRAAS